MNKSWIDEFICLFYPVGNGFSNSNIQSVFVGLWSLDSSIEGQQSTSDSEVINKQNSFPARPCLMSTPELTTMMTLTMMMMRRCLPHHILEICDKFCRLPGLRKYLCCALTSVTTTPATGRGFWLCPILILQIALHLDTWIFSGEREGGGLDLYSH